MTTFSRRDFGKAIAAAAVVGGGGSFVTPTWGEIAPGSSPSVDSHVPDLQSRPDSVLVQIADYVDRYHIKSEIAYSSAYLLLLDSLACGFYALSFPACTQMLGPIVPGIVVPNGARVPGTNFELDPVEAAFNITCMLHWLDFNDLGEPGTGGGTPGHPSDNLGGILAAADYLSRTRVAQGKTPLIMRDVLTAFIKAYEVQSVVSSNGDGLPPGLDYAWWTNIATAAVVTKMFDGSPQEIVNSVSQAFADLTTLRLFRDQFTVGTRKSWNSADAASRGVRLALITLKGEMGYPTVLTAKKVGVYDALFNGRPFQLGSFGTYAVEHALLKPVYPAEIGIQTPLECAAKLYPVVKNRLNDIDEITIWTYSNNWNRTGEQSVPVQPTPLANSAARDHDLKYAIAVELIFGNFTAEDLEDRVAADPRIDALRAKMIISVDRTWTADSKSEKSSFPGAIQIQFKDGTRTDKVEVQYPLGHPRRRDEATPVLRQKFQTSLDLRFSSKQQERIHSICQHPETFDATPVNKFMEAFATPDNPIRDSTIGFVASSVRRQTTNGFSPARSNHADVLGEGKIQPAIAR